MNRRSLMVLWVLLISTLGCSALDRAYTPDAKRDVIKVNHEKFPDNFWLNFKVKYLEDRWWKEPQRTVPAYMKNYDLIPEECKGEVEILASGGTENQSLGWARFRCKK